MLTKGAIGNLINRYRAVLDKCRLLNVFGSLAVAGMLVMGGAGVAGAESYKWIQNYDELEAFKSSGATFGIKDIYTYGGVFAGYGKNVIFDFDGFTFSSNSATTSGGAILFNQTSNTINKSTFDKNTSTAYGGALYIDASESEISETNFSNNEVNNKYGRTYGGAIAFENSSIEINNSYFSENKQIGSGADGGLGGGGAIWGGEASSIEIINGEFNKNTATGSGGAIRLDGGNLTIKGENSKFTENVSDGWGGAIAVLGSSTASSQEVSITNAIFENNHSNQEGGAIYISTPDPIASLDLSGSNTFSGNTDSYGDNDITSANPVTVSGGETDLRSGYKQAFDDTSTGGTNPTLTVARDAKLSAAAMTLGDASHDGGSVTVETGGILGNGTANMDELKAAIDEAKANGVDTTQGAYVGKKSLNLAYAGLTVGTASDSSTGSAGNPVFGDASALVVDQKALGENAAFTGVTTANLSDTTQMHIQNAVAGQTVIWFDNDTDPTNVNNATVSIKDSQGESSSITPTSNEKMFEFDPIVDGQTGGATTARVGNVANVLPGLSPELGALVTDMYNAGLNDPNAPQRGRAFLSRLANTDYMGNDPAGAVRALESTARMTINTVPQMTTAAHSIAQGAVLERVSLAGTRGSGLVAMNADGTLQTGLSAGDAVTGLGLWAMPLYQHWNANGLDGQYGDLDVSGDMGGVAIGMDYTFDNALRVGLTFNVGAGDAESDGAFNKTDNDFTFWGIGAYAGWTFNNIGLSADISYTATENELTQTSPAALQMGNLESDVDGWALGLGVRGEYQIRTNALDITPHVGVRYTHYSTDSYDVKSALGTILTGDSVDQDVWTFPVGVTLSKDINTAGGWIVRPSLDLSVIPAAGDLKAEGDVRFTGVNGSARLESQVMDYVTFGGQAGLELEKGNMSFGVNYDLKAGADTTAHGVFGVFRVKF